MFKIANLLIVDDDSAIAKVFEKLSENKKWIHQLAKSAEEAISMLDKQVFEVAVVDIRLPGFTGLDLLDYVKKNGLHTEVVIMTGVGSVETAVEAMKKGAYDYLTKPFDDISRVGIILEKAMERFRLMQQIRTYERRDAFETGYEGIIGRSHKMQDVFDLIDNIAPTTATVLILGESGTGKELVARAIHNRSQRSEKSFVVINCAAIPVHLLESELFGHKRGSFTGAISDKRGLFEEADGGTIFLDEIGEIPPSIQVKLLRVLQEGELRAVGDVDVKHVDVRLVAATNQELLQMVKDGRFREDLYYRLNVISVDLPPLRDRSEDIPTLAYYFLRKYSEKMKKKVDKITVDALQALQGYSWVGNIRELENVIERAVAFAKTDVVCIRDIPHKILGETFYGASDSMEESIAKYTYKDAKEKALEVFNRAYMIAILRETAGNISFASEKAQMDRSNFKKLIKKCSINIDDFKKISVKEKEQP